MIPKIDIPAFRRRTKAYRSPLPKLHIAALIVVSFVFVIIPATRHSHATMLPQEVPAPAPEEPPEPEVKDESDEGEGFTRKAYVTGYNTVAGQTDSTPCIAANGYICGRTDVVACPTDLKLGSWVEIEGKRYECMDRTSPKHDGRFDISCDKDLECPYAVTGWKDIEVIK